MVAKNISIIDPALPDSVSDNLYLSVKISDSNVSCSVFDPLRKIILALETWNLPNNEGYFEMTENLNKIIEGSAVLKKTFGKTFLLLDNAVYTLVPEKIFVASDAKKYLDLVHTFDSNDKVNVDNINAISVKNIYLLPAELDNVAKKIFKNYEIKHTSTILINSVLSADNKNEMVLIFFTKMRIDIVVAKKEKLLFCNSFVFTSAEDMIYYILNVYKQLGLDTSIAPVMLAGDIEKKSNAYQIIFKYIRNITFCRRPVKFQYYQGIQEVQEHMNYCLFNSFACVS